MNYIHSQLTQSYGSKWQIEQQQENNAWITKITVAHDLDDADEFINENCIDLLLLDLNLKNRDGFQLLQQSVAGAFHTIVVSANVHRAIEAFEYGVLDFVVKPFSKPRLAAVFARFNNTGSDSATSARYLSIKQSG
ncbi:MAG: two-component system response regulator LytT [Paraglaciecola sp.]|jgi:two-component system response regulator LytT